MANVQIIPMPTSYRAIRRIIFRPRPAPIFPDGEPSEADIELAKALFLALDSESQDWYRIENAIFRGIGIEPAAEGSKPRKGT